MKRISLLVVLMMLWANVAFAATNWKWSCSSDRVGWFFDTVNIHYRVDYNGRRDYGVIYYWEKEVYTPIKAQELADIYSDEALVSCSHSIKKCSINTRKRTFTAYEEFYYDGNGVLLKSITDSRYEAVIVPDTYGEKVYDDIVRYAYDHLK